MSEGASQPTPKREHAGCTLGMALGIALLVSLVAGIVALKTRVADGQRLFAEWFEPGTLPFDFEVAGATIELRGEQVVLLTRPDMPEEAAKAEQPEQKKRDRDEDKLQAPELYDWSKIATGPTGTPPVKVVLIGYPDELADSELEGLFGFSSDDEREIEITDVGPSGGRVTMDRGRLDWGPYSTRYVVDRELEWGGTFRDVARVNLTLPGRPCAMFVLWPRGFPASLERVSDLLAALVPQPADDEPSAAEE